MSKLLCSNNIYALISASQLLINALHFTLFVNCNKQWTLSTASHSFILKASFHIASNWNMMINALTRMVELLDFMNQEDNHELIRPCSPKCLRDILGWLRLWVPKVLHFDMAVDSLIFMNLSIWCPQLLRFSLLFPFLFLFYWN